MRRSLWVAGAGLAVLVLAAFADMLQGSGGVAASQVLTGLFDPNGTVEDGVVQSVRAPRAAAGVVAGGSLAASAVLLQALTRNRLAEPGTLGLTAGGGLAIALWATVGSGGGGLSAVLVAGAGVAIGGFVVLALALAARAGPLRLVLAGMAVSLALAALTSAIQLLDETRTADLFFWGAGSLVQLGWDDVEAAAAVATVALGAALVLARPLDVAVLGAPAARALGQRTRAVTVAAAAAAVVLTAAAVGVSGPIAFVGLAAVAVARASGASSRWELLAVAVPWGGALVLLADVIGRLALGADAEMPVGVTCAILGAPVLILVARRLPADVAPVVTEGAGFSRRRGLALAVPALLTCSALAGLCLGELTVGPADLARAAAGAGSPLADLAIDLRAPRLGVAMLAGGCLAAAGTIFQGVVRNPLASPEVVGVTGGASVGALALLLLASSVPAWGLSVAAVAGGVAALAAVLALAGPRSASPVRLALMGLGVTALCSGLTAVLVFRADPAATTAVTFLAGSTYGVGWRELWLIAVPALLLLPLALLAGRALDVLGLGDETAAALGLPLGASRAALLLLGAALAGTAVAVAGATAFVGLVAPHAGRLLVGSRHLLLTPVAIGLGMSLLAAGDVIGRLAFAPTEIPSGIVVAVIGAPYFAWLLLRTRASAA
ncbi:MAG: iron ABC transporter permease [Thermoleophilaceae bacterium]|nr:iron ABC transporter permease [Thermoleophilaceae bacterium]